MGTYVDEGGVENIACALIRQAKSDFIKGAKFLYMHLGKVPPFKELMADSKNVSLSNCTDVRWMYDAWRFVRDDPYDMFGNVGEEQIIKSWTNAAILDYYKKMYIDGGAILLKKKVAKRIYELTDDQIISNIDDKKLAEDFIAARNYISKSLEAKELFKEWTIAAYTRSRRLNIGSGRHSIADTDYHKNLVAKRQKNIERAKELHNEGISIKAIAKELGVQIRMVNIYLRS